MLTKLTKTLLLNLLALVLLPHGVAVGQKPAAHAPGSQMPMNTVDCDNANGDPDKCTIEADEPDAPAVAVFQSNVVKVPVPANDHNQEVRALEAHNFELTELQKARLDAARQEMFRWQDKMQEAAQKFVAICDEAQKENHWPAVQCGINDLKVTPVPPPAPPAKPADK